MPDPRPTKAETARAIYERRHPAATPKPPVVPDEAVEAAARELADPYSVNEDTRNMARDMLTAAAPFIAAEARRGLAVDRKTPAQWATERGIRIIDPIGWNQVGAPPFDAPLTLREFYSRCTLSTIGPLEVDERCEDDEPHGPHEWLFLSGEWHPCGGKTRA